MRLRAPSTLRILRLKVNRTVKVQRAIGVDVDVQRLEIGRGIDEADVARLHEIICDDDVFLVRCDLDVVRADARLHFVGVVETLDVGEVGNVEGCDVVGGGEG